MPLLLKQMLRVSVLTDAEPVPTTGQTLNAAVKKIPARQQLTSL